MGYLKDNKCTAFASSGSGVAPVSNCTQCNVGYSLGGLGTASSVSSGTAKACTETKGHCAKWNNNKVCQQCMGGADGWVKGLTSDTGLNCGSAKVIAVFALLIAAF